MSREFQARVFMREAMLQIDSASGCVGMGGGEFTVAPGLNRQLNRKPELA